MSAEASHAKDKLEKKSRPRACDQCRRRKVRCNGGEIPAGSRCSNCISFEYECTYTTTSNKRTTDPEYVKSLEEEILELKKQLKSLSNESADSSARLSPITDTSCASTPVPHGVLSGFSTSSTAPSSPAASPEIKHAPQEDTESREELVELLGSMNLGVKHTHYIGKSSSLIFVRAATDLKREFCAATPHVPQAHVDKFERRQPEFWDATAKLIHPEPPHPFSSFPAPPLMQRLVQEYFVRMNDIYPLLHRPTFEHNINTGLHLRDVRFGSTVLLVCAIGSRFVDDEAVLPEGTKSWHWSGWTWFQQVNTTRRFVHISAPWVYDLQICFLIGMYIATSPVPHATHSVIGHGLRLAHDMGAHRRVAYGPHLTVEEELKKRAFWCLVMLDRIMCDKLGRPYNIDDEDFQVEFPVECDDEYWIVSGSELTFAQPTEKPSKITAFNYMLRLTRIHARAYREIYYLSPAKLRSDPEHAQRMVSELDSQLNEFTDSIPEHLKWSSHRPNSVFTNQSAFMYTCYYFLQIIIHRAFVPLPQRPSPVAFPSLAICTNAARSALHILDVQFTTVHDHLFPQAHWHPMTLFTCATVLLLNIWNAKRVGLMTDIAKDLKDVERALAILQTYEKSWVGAARLGYVLEDVIDAVKRSRLSPDDQRKRKRQESMNEDTSVPSDPRPEAQRLRHETPSHEGALGLPLHSDELGRLPIWPDLDGSTAPLIPGDYGDIWPVFGGETFIDTTGLLDLGQGHAPYDPEFEAMFANLFPEMSYGDAAGPSSQNNQGLVGDQSLLDSYPPPLTAGTFPSMSSVQVAPGHPTSPQFSASPATSANYGSPDASTPEGSMHGPRHY